MFQWVERLGHKFPHLYWPRIGKKVAEKLGGLKKPCGRASF